MQSNTCRTVAWNDHSCFYHSPGGVAYQNSDNSHTHNLTQSLAVNMCYFWTRSILLLILHFQVYQLVLIRSIFYYCQTGRSKVKLINSTMAPSLEDRWIAEDRWMDDQLNIFSEAIQGVTTELTKSCLIG